MARGNGFGKRRYEPIKPVDPTLPKPSKRFGLFDIVGLIVLSAMAYLILFPTHLGMTGQDGIVGYICRALELPMNFATEGWHLRTSIAANITSHSASIDIPVRSILVAFHQVSLILGLGTALFLDIYLVRYLSHRRISQQTLEVADFSSRIVSAGLFMIWISGLAILLFYYQTDPQLLENPKIWGKLYIVCALTANGALIHRYGLPSLKQNLGKSILDGKFSDVAANHLPLVAISVVSWSFAFLLGAFKELNNVVASTTIIYTYLATVAGVYLLLVLGCSIMTAGRLDKPLNMKIRVS